MVLLHPQIPHGEPRSPHGGEELVAVVLQGEQPGAGRRTDGEQGALQPQRSAVGSELGARQGRPALPERCQMPLLPPLGLKSLQALIHRRGGGAIRRGQHSREATPLLPPAVRDPGLPPALGRLAAGPG